jgi:hypothetical protein
LPADSYRRREPERTVLYQALLEHTETFLAQNTVPAFVGRTFRRYLDCGVLARGFLRVACRACRSEVLVAFSCKDRGLCPSCTARRAAQTAAHLVDEILPHVPLRQWVLAAPFDLHHRLARDATLAKAALAIFIDEIERFLYGAVADDEADTPADEAQATPADAPFLGEGRRARAGFFTVTQAFGSALNLHVHWHVLATDGLYEQQPDGTLRFLRAAPATQEELTSVVQRVAARVRALVGEPDESAEPVVQAPVMKVFGAEPRDNEQPSRAVQHDGFNLHANVRLAPCVARLPPPRCSHVSSARPHLARGASLRVGNATGSAEAEPVPALNFLVASGSHGG